MPTTSSRISTRRWLAFSTNVLRVFLNSVSQGQALPGSGIFSCPVADVSGSLGEMTRAGGQVLISNPHLA